MFGCVPCGPNRRSPKCQNDASRISEGYWTATSGNLALRVWATAAIIGESTEAMPRSQNQRGLPALSAERLAHAWKEIITQNFMSQENEIEAEKSSLTKDFLPSDGASCSACGQEWYEGVERECIKRSKCGFIPKSVSISEMLRGRLVGFDCREKTLTFAMDEMPSTGALGESGLIYLPNETSPSAPK